jgi:hypothetical protein
MKRTTLAACIIAACILVVLALVTAASANRLTYSESTAQGHWCNWSITATCQRWKANRHKPSYWRECGPNDTRSGCMARGLR